MRERAFAVVLGLLLVTSMFAGVATFSVSAASAPEGMVAVPGQNIQDVRAENGPLSAQELTVYTDAHTETTEVSIVTDSQADAVGSGTPLPDVANQKICENPGKAADKNPNVDCEEDTTPSLVLSDDTHHEGRTVAIDSTQLKNALGEIPSFVTVKNSESGEEWERPTSVENGWVMIEAPHFSDNAVTWGGSVSVQGTYSDNSQVQYDLNSLDSASDVTINWTGVDSTETDTVTGANLGPGSTFDMEVAGSEPATSPQVTFEGTGFGAQQDNYSGSWLSPSVTESISVDGNLEPTDGSGGNPVLSVTGHTDPSTLNPYRHYSLSYPGSTTYVAGDDDADALHWFETKIVPDYSGKIDQISPKKHTDYGNPVPVDIYIEQGEPDSNPTSGTLVKSGWDPGPVSDHSRTNIPLDTEFSVSAGTTYSITFYSPSDNDGTHDWVKIYGEANSSYPGWVEESWSGSVSSDDAAVNIDYTVNHGANEVSVSDGVGHSHNFGNFSDWETKTTTLDLTTSSYKLDFSSSYAGSIDYELTMTEREGVDSPGIDVDGDGTDEASYNGVLLGSDSVTKSLPDLSVGSSATISATDGAADVSVSYVEHTGTEDPGVELNSENWANHTGTLADGETVSYTINKSALQEGTNTLNVSMPELSADAPPMQAELEYTHDARDEQTVSGTIEQFSERYNISKKFASDRTDPTVTIPFADEVVSIRDAEYRVNDGSWQTASYSLEGTDATFNLPDVTTNDTVTVRANASKVDVINGEIQVLEPSDIGDDLDSKIEITSADSSKEFALDVSGTVDSNLAHTTYEESWSANGYGIKTTQSHEYVLPDAGAGSTFRIKTAPLAMQPRSNEVIYEIPDDSDSIEPKISLSPGSTSGDTVDITFTNAKDSQKYILKSLTFGTQRDSGTASSPLTLADDDSDELLQFQEEDDGATDDSTSSTGFWDTAPTNLQQVEDVAPVVDPKLIALIMIAIVGLAVFYSEEGLEVEKPVHKRQIVWFSIGMAFFFALLFLDPRAFTGPIETMLNAALPLAGVLGVISVVGAGFLWWRRRQTEAATPDTVLKLGGKTIGGTDDPDEDGGGWL